MSLSANALTTLAKTKTYLEITSSSQDGLIEQLIDAVSSFILSYLDRDLKAQSRTVIFSGSGRTEKVLPDAPISGSVVLSNRYSPFVDSDWSGIDSDQFEVTANTGKIFMPSSFYRGQNNYRAVYTGGYTYPGDAGYDAATNKLPFDIEMAVWELVGVKLGTNKSGGVESEQVKNIRITYAKALSDNPHIKELLDRYKRYYAG